MSVHGPFPIIPAKNLDTSVAFYRSVMKMTCQRQDEQAALMVSGSHTLLLSVGDAPVSEHAVAGWSVNNLRAEMLRLKERGVEFTDFGLGKDGIADFLGDKVTWFQDPAGNVLSLTQFAL